jgi:hypothetical protein
MSDVVIPHRTLSNIEDALNGLARVQIDIASDVVEVARRQDHTLSAVALLRQEFDSFLAKDARDKALQTARAEIMLVRQQLESEFGHYGDVRRQATGMLQAMDAGVVTEGVIQQVSEESMLATPRYWLAPALVALASWMRDDRPIAERALAEALSRDNDKTALFFALVLRRHGRVEATARWLRQYVARQDPARLSREFVVVLDAAASGALGPQARPLMMTEIDRWHERLGAQQEVVDAQVKRWRGYLDKMRTPIPATYRILPEISPTWATLKDLYEGATVHAQAHQRLSGLFEGPPGFPDDLRERVDDILANLVTRYDDAEAPLRRELATHEAVIKHDGDLQQAQRAVQDDATTLASTVDFLSLVTDAAFLPDKIGASKGTQRLAITMARGWIGTAAGQLEAANASGHPAAVELNIEGWAGRVDGQSTQEGLSKSLAHYLDQKTTAELAAIRFAGGGALAMVLAFACLGIAIVCAVQKAPGGAAVLAVAGLCLAVGALYSYSQLPTRREQVAKAGEARKQRALTKVHGAVAEIVDLRREWSAQLGAAPQLRSFLDGLTPDPHLAADQPRTVFR